MSPLATGGAPAARQSPTAVWTGEEMIVWGGRNDAGLGLARSEIELKKKS